MEYKHYYAVLGVGRQASERAIKKAYRRLARRWHPDTNPDDVQAEEKFREINEAYEVLDDQRKRTPYDRPGNNWIRWQQGGGDPGQFDWSQWSDGAPHRACTRWSANLVGLFGGHAADTFSDFFNALFREMGGRQHIRTAQGIFGRSGIGGGRASPRSENREVEVTITLEEALTGTSRVLERDGQRIRVTIPPGMNTGSRVSLLGKGYAGPGNAGHRDPRLNVTMAPHTRFERAGDDLLCKIYVDLYTAVLGGQPCIHTRRRRISQNSSRDTVRPDIPAAAQGDAGPPQSGPARKPTRYCQHRDSWRVEPARAGALRGTGPY